jgi:hypothetical protein
MNETISVEKVATGMIIGSPVKNLYGQIIIGENTVVNENHLRLLKTWGIKEVVIKSNDSTKDDEEEILSYEIKEIIKKRIPWLPLNNFEKELYSLAIEFIKKS